MRVKVAKLGLLNGLRCAPFCAVEEAYVQPVDKVFDVLNFTIPTALRRLCFRPR